MEKYYNEDKTILTLEEPESQHLMTNAVFSPNQSRMIFEYNVEFNDFIKMILPTSIYSLHFSSDYRKYNRIDFFQLVSEISNLLLCVKKIIILCDTMCGVQTYIRRIAFGCVVTDGNSKIYFE